MVEVVMRTIMMSYAYLPVYAVSERCPWPISYLLYSSAPRRRRVEMCLYLHRLGESDSEAKDARIVRTNALQLRSGTAQGRQLVCEISKG